VAVLDFMKSLQDFIGAWLRHREHFNEPKMKAAFVPNLGLVLSITALP